MQELRSKAFDLAVDWDELSGERKSEKAEELIIFLGRENRLSELQAYVEKVRRGVQWPALPADVPWLTASSREDTFRISLIHQVRVVWIKGVLEQL